MSHARRLLFVTNFSKYTQRNLQTVRKSKPYRGEFLASSLRLPVAKYGGRQTVTVLAGDGIGPEMMECIKRVFSVSHAPIDFEDIELDSRPGAGDVSMNNAIIAIERNGIALKGNIETKFDDPTVHSRNVELRTRLDLYANVLHCQTVRNVPSRHKDIDIVIIRENTEGEYSGLEHETVPGVVESLKIVTRRNIERIARFAFDYAVNHGRKKVTAVHKANIMKLGDGLFLRVCKEMAQKEYSQLQFEHMIVDNASMQMVARPQQFDLMLMPNLYGNIISNIACGLVGGPGLVSGMNIGDHYAVFETGTRNTGTSLVGKDLANPTAFLRAGVDMLRYLRLNEHAEMIEGAVVRTLEDRQIHTPDLHGQHRTSEFMDSVIADIEEQMKSKH
uniref:Isocitrate dehydrogenase [NAD] subunit, mitochondrial n=1 Tax=Plectus sambesii TaxID=2011161 RepID=A0A914VT14_9BILA